MFGRPDWIFDDVGSSSLAAIAELAEGKACAPSCIFAFVSAILHAAGTAASGGRNTYPKVCCTILSRRLMLKA